MPQMGESIAEGTLSRWLKKVGDEVKRDEPIFEISTDKVDAEIPAPTAGVLAEILVTEGQTVAVQTVVARIETEKGAAVAAAPAPRRRRRPRRRRERAAAAAPAHRGAAADRAGRRAAPLRRAAPRATGGNGSFEDALRTKSSPLVRKIAAEHGIEIARAAGQAASPAA